MKSDLTKYLPPETYRDLASHGGRIAALEKAWGSADPANITREICFSFPGLLQTTTSPIYLHPTGARLVRAVASLATPGSGATVIQPLLNGVAAGSGITLAAGVSQSAGFFGQDDIMVADSTPLRVQVVTAGQDASGLNVQVRFAPLP